MHHCKQCNSDIRESATLCFSCGVVQNVSPAIECENHGGEHAVGLCVLCGKPVCGDCAISADGKTFCEIAQHQLLFQQWSVVHESDFEFESDMIQRNIAAEGIETKVFSFREHLGTLWLSESRPVRVMVPKGQHQRATELLQRLRLINEQGNNSHGGNGT